MSRIGSYLTSLRAYANALFTSERQPNANAVKEARKPFVTDKNSDPQAEEAMQRVTAALGGQAGHNNRDPK